MKKFLQITATSGIMMAASAMAQEEVEVEEVIDTSWESSVDFGLNLSKGNTDSLLVRGGIQTEKKEDKDAYFASLGYSYGEEDSATNQDEIVGKASWRRTLTGKNFFGVLLDGRSDQFADLDYRFSLNFTYGYYWIDTEETFFSTEVGLGVTTEDKGRGNDTYMNGLFVQRFEHKFNESAKLFESFSISPRLDDFSDYHLEFQAGLETKITETMAFKVSLENRYESKPADDKEKNDLKLVAGVSYKF
ncbi:YdiY family protein [Rubritalea spongiae]|uniref:YdiY family protein n=1 Tax=Rubritalea spongiae TaxID=430797 RepID=A0ABW5DYU6_9BACT